MRVDVGFKNRHRNGPSIAARHLDEAQIQNPDVFFNMGINLFKAGEIKDAIAYFGKTIGRDAA